ncbi:hypothetical protein CcaverHIS002_0411690 [Cutaneotrichosporon cavernicola]|uniref:Uncharacterized protein n=1 Tax=Cutaneotrichosporon cavernicola TaxID=279322 RepID=A0AA48QWF7_9TREE|nr:uncharacterized protein CcaverHIS019_0411630 [Cutaneotrichosporon cavernicola]BEI84565.1 hypothetical protein CcaverHIS002_0411690 [Cutaneotrichosporon cavernicola]BEI92343.1 hypothetical protein CcaverHIS019_0411630 [Cutaneotrichosporon cavernicola]BEJ00112.1 hypothetical protein CcaverHIS631_0411540 [Cutaneotrichosporon cavernicola]BEJ07883.1 hypothetical protein CcaverHIS641_0411520 [Cutaneotrichosporon cavernicola]
MPFKDALDECYPHILDDIVDYSEYAAHIPLYNVNHYCRNRIDTHQAKHLVWDDGLFTKTLDGQYVRPLNPLLAARLPAALTINELLSEQRAHLDLFRITHIMFRLKPPRSSRVGPPFKQLPPSPQLQNLLAINQVFDIYEKRNGEDDCLISFPIKPSVLRFWPVVRNIAWRATTYNVGQIDTLVILPARVTPKSPVKAPRYTLCLGIDEVTPFISVISANRIVLHLRDNSLHLLGDVLGTSAIEGTDIVLIASGWKMGGITTFNGFAYLLWMIVDSMNDKQSITLVDDQVQVSKRTLKTLRQKTGVPGLESTVLADIFKDVLDSITSRSVPKFRAVSVAEYEAELGEERFALEMGN